MNSYRVDHTKWARLNIFEQMGNIGSEVGRSIKADRNGDEADRDSAIARALDLFEATASALSQKKSPRAREVLRAKDQFLQLFYGDNPSRQEVGKLESYFMQFAIAARLRR